MGLLNKKRKRLSEMTDEELATTVLESPAVDTMEPTCVELARRVMRLTAGRQNFHAMRMEFFEGFTHAMNRHLVCPLNAAETRKVLEACYAFIRANYADLLDDVDSKRRTWRDAGAEFYERRYEWGEGRHEN